MGWGERLGRIAVPLGLVVLLAVCLQHLDMVAAWLVWMRAQGPLGHVLFAAFYLGGTLAMVPASILEAGAGFLYGPVLGIAVASLLGTACATCSFALGRTVFRGAVERRIAGSPRLQAIDRAVAAEGWRLVLLLRLSPLAPFNLMSAALGATPVAVTDFVVGTMVGHLFPVVVFAWTGSTVATALDLVERTAPPAWATGVGIGLTVLATIGVSRFAKRTLDAALAER